MALKVLVVDDSEMVRQRVSAALTEAVIDVIEATDGRDAMEKVRASGDLSLVVCDINMPVMDGFEFLEQLRQEPTRSAIPVVMLTTEGHPEVWLRAKVLGAKALILKPFKGALLVAAVRKLAGSGDPR